MILPARRIVLWALLLSLCLAAGCQTSAGFANGVASATEGMTKDAAGIWQGILRIDNWIKENLW
jgi:hypothetical protein